MSEGARVGLRRGASPTGRREGSTRPRTDQSAGLWRSETRSSRNMGGHTTTGSPMALAVRRRHSRRGHGSRCTPLRDENGLVVPGSSGQLRIVDHAPKQRTARNGQAGWRGEDLDAPSGRPDLAPKRGPFARSGPEAGCAGRAGTAPRRAPPVEPAFCTSAAFIAATSGPAGTFRYRDGGMFARLPAALKRAGGGPAELTRYSRMIAAGPSAR